ncbi:hypothetical protein Golax_003665 [Gossypium laxum]|uniref:CCHC-type domain-containing protein n=1 Tax=Gossypium laxum TaxID=34288 RepID=A0A7J9AG50_9ROSI|nr:hypothetical protein [Gossypium laxum]
MLEDSDLSSNGSDSPTKVSWKQMLLGQGDYNQEERFRSASNDSAENFDFLEGDVKKTMVNGIPAIEFSERIQQILFKDMETTVVLKLLGRNISYTALFNRISSLWRPTKPFHLMDIENGFFLGKLQCIKDYNKALSQGSWIIHGQYLIVQPWTKFFNPKKLYPFSQVMVNGELQRVEYQVLPTICFSCGKYGHLKEQCTSPAAEKIIVSREKSRRGQKDLRNQKGENQGKARLGSRFSVLNRKESQDLRDGVLEDRISGGDAKEIKNAEGEAA